MNETSYEKGCHGEGAKDWNQPIDGCQVERSIRGFSDDFIFP